MSSDFKLAPLQELCFAVVGLGLIGGSYIKALRKLQVKKIIGLDIDKNVLRRACTLNLLDEALTEADERLKEADVIICALYPQQIKGFVEKNAGFFKEDVLITDVAGVKNNLSQELHGILPPSMEFISGHPMAGRQSSGFDMSSADIFQNANYIIVADEFNSPQAAVWLENFAIALGCKNTVRVAPAEHDKIIAYTSNLPHITAVALMDSASFNEKTKYFVAGSFRDGTRVADINPELWSSLFLANKEAVIEEIDIYIDELLKWKKALRKSDAAALKELMSKASVRRKDLY